MSQYIPTIDPLNAASSSRALGAKKLTGPLLVVTWAVLIAAPWITIYEIARLAF